MRIGFFFKALLTGIKTAKSEFLFEFKQMIFI